MKNTSSKGQAAILLIFVLGMIATIIGYSQVKLGNLESFRGRSSANSLQAYYSANSGIEDAIKKIKDDPVYSGKYNLTVPALAPANNVTITVTDSGTDKLILSVAKYNNYVRRINVVVENTGGVDFSNAVYAGNGGLYLDSSTVVSNLDFNKNADVYSESFVRGKNRGNKVEIDKKSGTLICNPNSSSAIYGNAKIEQIISGFVGDTNPNRGVCVTGDAYSQILDRCLIGGKGVYGKFGSIGSCLAGKGANADPVKDSPPFEKEDFPEINVIAKENAITGTTYSGNCELSNTSTSDCSNGTGQLGNIKIDGNLTIDNNLKITGDIFVTKNILFKSNKANITMTDDNKFKYLIADGIDGKIVIKSGVKFTQYDKTFLVLVSAYNEGANLYCNDGNDSNDAINVAANVKSVLLYAKNGCISMSPTASSEIIGAVYGKEVYLKNVNLKYDSDLGTGGGGNGTANWVSKSFNEY
jgi:hypothetical protein